MLLSRLHRFKRVKAHPLKIKKIKKCFMMGKSEDDAKYTTMKNDPNYFPQTIHDLEIGRDFCIMSDELDDPGHPGFKDPVYRERRNMIAKIANDCKIGMEIPRVEYTDVEIKTWKGIYNKLMSLYPTHACDEHNKVLPLLQRECNMTSDNIPQLEDISKFLRRKTGFRLVPVKGLLAPRYFLNALAFRVFNSTQYLRHHSVPDYTPEPDIVHELLGHVPLLADPDFAKFTQIVGLASLGATEEDINRLSRCYWYTVEFGLVKNKNGKRRANGSGLLSSFGELEYCMSDMPKVEDFDPFKAAEKEYPITVYQPFYYIASSFDDMTKKMENFTSTLQRPFTVEFDEKSWTVKKVHNTKTSNKQKHASM